MLVAVATPLASCTTNAAPPPPDPLAALAATARADAADAEAIASSVPAIAERASQVARARKDHAVALQHEVDRERPPTTSSSSATPPSGRPDAVDPAAARTRLLDALHAAERQAADLVTAVPRYRAGLVGSVAASCASLREVVG